MFYKSSVTYGIDKQHHFIQQTFMKEDHTYFTCRDLELLLFYQIRPSIRIWIKYHGIVCVPYVKFEYATENSRFDNQWLYCKKSIEAMKPNVLHEMNHSQCFKKLYFRLYY